jgi:uncharacterized protein involved in cysteine biosynthesis
MHPAEVYLTQYAPMLLVSLGFAVVAYKLAREKGRNVALWTILGAIPVLNFVCIPFFVGAANLELARKLDEIIARR